MKRAIRALLGVVLVLPLLAFLVTSGAITFVLFVAYLALDKTVIDVTGGEP